VLKTVDMTKPRKMWFYQLEHDGDPMGRIKAAHQLGKIGSAEAVDALAKALLREKFWGVQIEIAGALADAHTEQAFAALQKGLGIKHVKARRAVVEAIGKFRRPESLDLLKKALEAKDSYYVPAEACRAIGKVRTPAALKVLEQQLEVESWNDSIRSGAIDALAALNSDEVVPTLKERTAYGAHQISRTAAVRALGTVGKGRGDVVDHLLKLVTDKFLRVQVTAIAQLGHLGDPRALGPLKALVDREDVDRRLLRVAEEAIREIREGLDPGPDTDAIKRENEELKKKLERLEGKAKKAAAA
jgi:aminopeptidase N